MGDFARMCYKALISIIIILWETQCYSFQYTVQWAQRRQIKVARYVTKSQKINGEFGNSTSNHHPLTANRYTVRLSGQTSAVWGTSPWIWQQLSLQIHIQDDYIQDDYMKSTAAAATNRVGISVLISVRLQHLRRTSTWKPVDGYQPHANERADNYTVWIVDLVKNWIKATEAFAGFRMKSDCM